MIDRQRFSLNRIISPSLTLGEFLELTARLGLSKVELRNDLDARDPVDDMKPAAFARMAADHGVGVISINALQKFNLAAARAKASDELKRLLDLSAAIGCKAVVLCPNNDAADARSHARRIGETIDALAAFGPLFRSAGILGYVEPLGFAISSLASLVVAQDAIRESGQSCFKVVHDTFHHFIGPDDQSVLGTTYGISMTGLVHVSGVEANIPRDACRDEHRVLVGPADTMKSKEQILHLEKLGYAGDYSFEPFSPEIQKLGKSELAAALRQSLDYLLA